MKRIAHDFKPWFNILMHTQSIVCATVDSCCLEYLGLWSLFQQKILKLRILNSHKLFNQSVLLGLWFLLLNYLGDSSVTVLMTLALIKSWLWPNITENSPNVMEWHLLGLVALYGKLHQTVLEKNKNKFTTKLTLYKIRSAL